MRWEIKEKVRNLRKEGLTYREIRKTFPLAKSTVSDWCKDIELTEEQKKKIGERQKEGARYASRIKGANTNALKRQKEIKLIKALARKEIKRNLTKMEFRIAGAMLYWGEGRKSGSVEITNSDPKLIAFMMKWFREVCHISNKNFRAMLHLHSGQNELEMKKYWSGITGIPLEQFGKSFVKPEGSGYRKNILYNGTIKIRVCGSKIGDLMYRILAWVEEIYFRSVEGELIEKGPSSPALKNLPLEIFQEKNSSFHMTPP